MGLLEFLGLYNNIIFVCRHIEGQTDRPASGHNSAFFLKFYINALKRSVSFLNGLLGSLDHLQRSLRKTLGLHRNSFESPETS